MSFNGFCLCCTGKDREDIRTCRFRYCPFYPFRRANLPWQDIKEEYKIEMVNCEHNPVIAYSVEGLTKLGAEELRRKVQEKYDKSLEECVKYLVELGIDYFKIDS